MDGITLESVGVVASEFKKPEELFFACEDGLKTETYSKILVDERFRQGLAGLEEFSHVFVIYLLDLADKIELVTHPGPPSEAGLPKVGVFASRSQYRPNHLALRLVRLLKVEDNIIHVKGLDAVDGSRVLDVKPYVKGFDRPDVFKGASWYDWLER